MSMCQDFVIYLFNFVNDLFSSHCVKIRSWELIFHYKNNRFHHGKLWWLLYVQQSSIVQTGYYLSSPTPLSLCVIFELMRLSLSRYNKSYAKMCVENCARKRTTRWVQFSALAVDQQYLWSSYEKSTTTIPNISLLQIYYKFTIQFTTCLWYVYILYDNHKLLLHYFLTRICGNSIINCVPSCSIIWLNCGSICIYYEFSNYSRHLTLYIW